LRGLRISDSKDAPLLTECSYAADSGNRVYWRERERISDTPSGFDFVAVSWVQCDGEEEDQWGASCEVDPLFRGVAYWDGLRHLWAGGDDNERGYVYYLSAAEAAAIFRIVAELERRFCADESKR
jgi:hypothetical protein